MKKVLVECLGTFFFVMTFAMTFHPFVVASMLMAWIYIGRYISGGHYNPLITLAATMRGDLGREHLAWYIGAQIVGSVFAFAAAAFLHGHGMMPVPGSHATMWQAGFMEVLLAFVFVLVWLVATSEKKFHVGHVYGFVIAFTFPALAEIGGSISGGLFNPAIALGAALCGLVTGLHVVWLHIGMYIVCALVGGLVATHAYNYFTE